MSKPIFVLNGPNLNLLGMREPEKYGRETLVDLERLCAASAAQHGAALRFLQSNAEHQLIDWVHEASGDSCGIVINPAGYSHTSVALRDALATFDGPLIEVHITNIHKREEFRHHSLISAVVDGVICGLGIRGYAFAINQILSSRSHGNDASVAGAADSKQVCDLSG